LRTRLASFENGNLHVQPIFNLLRVLLAAPLSASVNLLIETLDELLNLLFSRQWWFRKEGNSRAML